MTAPPRKFAPIAPSTIEDVERLATLAVNSGWGKDADDKDKRHATATLIILQGLEVGLPPTQALQQIMVDAQGRFLIWGDAVPGLLWAAGFKLQEWFEGEGANLVAHCEIVRPDGTTISRMFSVAEAKRARLWDDRAQVKGQDGMLVDNDSMWFRFSTRMLQMRARGFAVKDGASDVTRGLYIREEYAREYNSPIVRERDTVARPMPSGPPKPPGTQEAVTAEPTVEREPEADVAEAAPSAAADPEPAAEVAKPEAVTAAEKPKPRPPRPPKPPTKETSHAVE